MFSKLTMTLAVMMSLTLVSNAHAQTTKAKSKKATAKTTVAETKKAEDERLAAEAAKKAEEAKALEAKRLEEAKVAADKKTASDSSAILGYLKSHFSVSYHGEFYAHRRVDVYNDRVSNGVTPDEGDKKIQDIKMMHVPTIIYRPMTNWKFLVTSEFNYTDGAEYIASSAPIVAPATKPANATTNSKFINRHYRSLVALTRENILVEKEHGIKLDVGIARRIFDRNHGKASSYGNSRVNTNISKSFGEKLSTSVFIQYLGNDPAKGRITPATWEHNLEIIPTITWQITEKLSYVFNDDFILGTPWQKTGGDKLDAFHEMNVGYVTYQINDKNSTYFQLKYYHAPDDVFAVDPMVQDWFEYYIGYTYAFTPKMSVTAEVGSELARLHDGRDVFAQKFKYPEFALYIDLAL